MAHWYVNTIPPRTHFGAASPWYIGTNTERIPTATPLMKRLPQKSFQVVAAIIMLLPAVKTIAVVAMMIFLRPYLFERKGAINAPKKDPKDNTAVISALSSVVNSLLLLNLRLTNSISSTLLAKALLYPYKNPPNAATNPTIVAPTTSDFSFKFLSCSCSLSRTSHSHLSFIISVALLPYSKRR